MQNAKVIDADGHVQDRDAEIRKFMEEPYCRRRGPFVVRARLTNEGAAPLRGVALRLSPPAGVFGWQTRPLGAVPVATTLVKLAFCFDEVTLSHRSLRSVPAVLFRPPNMMDCAVVGSNTAVWECLATGPLCVHV